MRSLKQRLADSVMVLSPLRKAFVGFSFFAIPTYLSLGFGEQSSDPMSTSAPIYWFMAAAIHAIVAFWLWEEIFELNRKYRVIFLLIIGVSAIAFINHEVRWVTSAADETAHANQLRDARDSQVLGMEFHISQASKCPVCASSSGPVNAPEIALRIVWKKQISLFVEATKGIVRDARYNVGIWDLDIPGVQMLPIPFTHDAKMWIKPGEPVGPDQLVGLPNVAAMIKNGDRLLGIAQASCPECNNSPAYFIYAVHGEGGWFGQFPRGKYPSITYLFQHMEEIKKNPELVLSVIPRPSRIEIQDVH